MLPDFPKSKNEMLRFLLKKISRLEKERNPILAQIKTFTQQEGKTLTFEQVDYGKKTQQSEERLIAVDIKINEIPTLVGEALARKIMLLAEQSGALKMKTLFSRIEEATEQTGKRLDAQGKAMDGQMLLDMIDMAEAGFDRFGKSTSSFIIHPNLAPALRKASEEVENDPELKRRLESINSRQRQQWVDRENRRKLVE